MSFLEQRIQNDIKTLAYPIKISYKEKEAQFSMSFDSKIYKRAYSFIVKYPDAYPFKSPRVYIEEHIFHPNIDNGNICLKILKENWQAAFDLNSIITSLILIMDEPSHEDAYNAEAADLLKYDFKQFLEKVKKVDDLNNNNKFIASNTK